MEKDISVRLTSLVKSSGCNAKLPPGDLRKVLERLPGKSDKRIIGGFENNDDALVFDLGDGTVLLETIDFFPPMVDDPYIFGEIAAANAISDIYAMGGKPIIAMSLMCFPSCLELSVMEEIMKGAIFKAKEAGIEIAGGHTISDREPKFGLAVTGRCRKDRIWTNGTAKDGDVLVITKPLGVGIIMTAHKVGDGKKEDIENAISSMRMLNKSAMENLEDLDVHAVTDVTGFSLLGHLSEMMKASGSSADIHISLIPLHGGTKSLAEDGYVPEGRYTNEDYIKTGVEVKNSISTAEKDILYSPETSGGLLISLAEKDAELFIKRMNDKAWIIGEVKGKRDKLIYVD